MDIIVSVFLAAALHTGPSCLPANAGWVQGVAAYLDQRDLANISHVPTGGTQLRDLAGPEVDAESEDLLFYFASHAEAISDLSEARLMPWLELRPLADQRPHQSSEWMQGAYPSEADIINTCFWSAARSFAPAPTLPSPHEGDLITSRRAER